MSLEAATGYVLKKLFLKISQYLQENTCVLKSLLNKVAGFFKMRLQHRGFLVNIVKSLRVPILKKPASVSPFLGNPRGRKLLRRPSASGKV